ncbi:MAG: SDR family oxidoreductase [bacterium]|nr:SDR family oxidoreductase [bacterium]
MAVAVVTGSSSGIGQATAVELARLGYSVVLHARSNVNGLQATNQMIAKLRIPSTSEFQSATQETAESTVSTLSITADISSAEGCRELVAKAFGWQGRVDVWVNNAGADVLTSELRTADFEDKLQRLWDVDVRGTIRIARSVSQRMLEQPQLGGGKPCIINIGWDQATKGMEGDAGQLFCTTKAAVEAFTRALALSVGPHIRVNAVAPGWIRTSWGETSDSYWDQRARNESLLGRWGTPEDVARTIAWLARQDAEFVNGQTIAVNGGFRCPTPPSDERKSTHNAQKSDPAR